MFLYDYPFRRGEAGGLVPSRATGAGDELNIRMKEGRGKPGVLIIKGMGKGREGSRKEGKGSVRSHCDETGLRQDMSTKNAEGGEE